MVIVDNAVARIRVTARRRVRPLHERLHQALLDAQQLSDVAAASTARETSRQAPESSPPPPDNSCYSHYERRIRLMVEALEREVDDARYGSSRLGGETPLLKLYRLLRDFEGIHSTEVAFIDRSFGSARTIERMRSNANRRPVDGVRR